MYNPYCRFCQDYPYLCIPYVAIPLRCMPSEIVPGLTPGPIPIPEPTYVPVQAYFYTQHYVPVPAYPVAVNLIFDETGGDVNIPEGNPYISFNDEKGVIVINQVGHYHLEYNTELTFGISDSGIFNFVMLANDEPIEGSATSESPQNGQTVTVSNHSTIYVEKSTTISLSVQMLQGEALLRNPYLLITSIEE